MCVAWDMPFVPAELLAALAALLAGADAAVPESDSRRGLEPLCAAYGPACGPAIRAAIARGDARAIGFHPDVRVARLPRDAVLQYGDPDVLFFNVNSPEDLARAEAICRNHDSYR
jgi:molybdopterin-guanine dinucleotide biosynthesis protein A